jgi:uncharacterized protein (DUF2235 family)
MPQKRLVVCADGTWNAPVADGANTNVTKLAKAVSPYGTHGEPQIVYYHKGVGERGGLWDHLTGGAFGAGIDANIEDIYLFLANNYQPNDELFLFGFSRGAYTVRSLAGLIRNSGLLRRDKLNLYGAAYALYRKRTDDGGPNSPEAQTFRARNAWPDFNLRFIGVWDTVGALGVPITPLRFWNKALYEFHDVTLSSHVDAAYQALAIDEKRKPFRPSIWTQQAAAKGTQAFEQAWFPGVHCNVGGGYADAGLSDGALAWMWSRATLHGLALDPPKPVGDPVHGKLQDSMTLFYRLLGDGTRKLSAGGPAAEEKIAPSTIERMHGGVGYSPANLLSFLKRVPPPEVTDP